MGAEMGKIVCPECGEAPRAPVGRRSWRAVAGGFWPVGLAVVIAGVVWGWAPRERVVGSISNTDQQRLRGPVTVGDLKRIVSREEPCERLRSAVLDPGLGRGFIPEITQVSAAKERPAPAAVDDAEQREWGWPASWATFRREPATRALLLWGPSGWWWQGDWTGVSFGDNGVGAAGSWAVRLNLLRMAGDLVVPAVLVAAAGFLRGRVRRWARVVAVGAGAAALAVGAGADPRWTSVNRAACNLASTLAQVRGQVATDEGCWALAFSLLGAVGEQDESAEVIVCLGSQWWRQGERAVLPGPIALAERGDLSSSGWTLRGLGCGADRDGVMVRRRVTPDMIREWAVTWEGIGLAAGVPAVLWLLWSAGWGLRAWRLDRRVRRGLCRRCGYDLRGIGGREGTALGSGGARA